MRETLTIQGAREYVAGYYAACEGVREAAIEGAGLTRQHGMSVCRLNVVVTLEDGSRGAVQWDVWEEPREDGSSFIYGEC